MMLADKPSSALAVSQEGMYPIGVQGGGAVGGSCLGSQPLPGPRAQRSTMKDMYNHGLGPKSQQTPCHSY